MSATEARLLIMPRYAAFLRAVNVGGRFIKMAALRDALTGSGLVDVTTYIQSGNVLLSTPLRSAAKVEAHIERAISASFGFEVDTMVRNQAELAAVVEAGNALADPFGGKARHMVSMLKALPDDEATGKFEAWPEPGVRGLIVGRELHLFYEMSMMDSKLTGPKLAKMLGCPGTVREWRVIVAVNDLLQVQT
jgi:uncharacterized protein (DUF1697 family)